MATSRVTYTDREIATAVLRNTRSQIAQLLAKIEAEPGRLLQRRFSSLASDYKRLGMFAYAVGEPLGVVSDAFAQSARAFLRVFELRGTDTGMPVAFVDVSAEGVVKREQRSPDYSLTNSSEGYLAVLLGRLGGVPDVADSLAALIWDPPDAEYIAVGSYCTPNDQLLAYALREMRLANCESARGYLDRVVASKARADIECQATMLRGIVGRNSLECQSGLKGLLCWHTTWTKRKEGQGPECFVNIPAIGLCDLAVSHGVLSPADIPDSSPGFPFELVSRY